MSARHAVGRTRAGEFSTDLNVRSVSLTVLAFAATMYLLHWAQEAFIPIVLSILISYALAPIVGALTPLLGFEVARLVFILGIVFAIVAFGEMLPLVFNNYAFMYLTVTALAMQLTHPNPYLWMAVAAVGGGLLIAGVIGIGRLVAAVHPERARTT